MYVIILLLSSVVLLLLLLHRYLCPDEFHPYAKDIFVDIDPLTFLNNRQVNSSLIFKKNIVLLPTACKPHQTVHFCECSGVYSISSGLISLHTQQFTTILKPKISFIVKHNFAIKQSVS